MLHHIVAVRARGDPFKGRTSHKKIGIQRRSLKMVHKRKVMYVGGGARACPPHQKCNDGITQRGISVSFQLRHTRACFVTCQLPPNMKCEGIMTEWLGVISRHVKVLREPSLLIKRRRGYEVVFDSPVHPTKFLLRGRISPFRFRPRREARCKQGRKDHDWRQIGRQLADCNGCPFFGRSRTAPTFHVEEGFLRSSQKAYTVFRAGSISDQSA